MKTWIVSLCVALAGCGASPVFATGHQQVVRQRVVVRQPVVRRQVVRQNVVVAQPLVFRQQLVRPLIIQQPQPLIIQSQPLFVQPQPLYVPVPQQSLIFGY